MVSIHTAFGSVHSSLQRFLLFGRQKGSAQADTKQHHIAAWQACFSDIFVTFGPWGQSSAWYALSSARRTRDVSIWWCPYRHGIFIIAIRGSSKKKLRIWTLALQNHRHPSFEFRPSGCCRRCAVIAVVLLSLSCCCLSSCWCACCWQRLQFIILILHCL